MIKNSIENSDIYYETDWTDVDETGVRIYPDKPDVEVEFVNEPALAMLLINHVVFLNSRWWETELPQRIKDSISINVSVNDVFAWGCSDVEELEYKDIQDLYEHWAKDPDWGSDVWAIKRRNLMPQKPVYDVIQEKGIWNLDDLNLRENEWCPYWKKYKKENM